MLPPEHDQDPYPSIPQALDRALRRATDRTLTSLTALRQTLGEHVHRERNLGRSLPDIQTELRVLISNVRHDSSDELADSEHSDTLSVQVREWTEVFFRTVK
jgi:hypothetical protein